MDTAQIFSLTGDEKVQDVIGRLKFISKIKSGEKLNVRELFVRDNDSVLQRVIRTIRNFGTYLSASDVVESKEATITFIQDTLNQAINLIMIYCKEDDEFKKNVASIIVENLEKSKIGIKNSIETYQNDRKFISRVEAIIQTMEIRIKSMKEKGYMNGLSDTSFMPGHDTSSEESS